MAALLGTLSSLCLGLSDLFVARSLRNVHVLTLTMTASLAAMVTSAFGLLVIDSAFIGRDVMLGALSGVFMGTGLSFYFRGMRGSAVGIVAPLAAVQVALWPLCYEVLNGARPAALVWTGVVVAMLGLILTTFSPELGDRAVVGLRMGLVSGAFFGFGVTLIGTTDASSGVWPVIAHRAAGVAVFAIAALASSVALFPEARSRVATALAGAFGGIALMFFIYGAQNYSFAVVAVTGSLFPAASAVLLYRFDDHPLRWWQAIGIGAAIAGVALISVG